MPINTFVVPRVNETTAGVKGSVMVVIKSSKLLLLFSAAAVGYSFSCAIEASGGSAAPTCTDFSREVGQRKKELVKSFVCESLGIQPCELRVTMVTRCGDEVGFIVVWSKPDEHPVQSWLVEWSADTLRLYPSE
jgi:hypothetical protein